MAPKEKNNATTSTSNAPEIPKPTLHERFTALRARPQLHITKYIRSRDRTGIDTATDTYAKWKRLAPLQRQDVFYFAIITHDFSLLERLAAYGVGMHSVKPSARENMPTLIAASKLDEAWPGPRTMAPDAQETPAQAQLDEQDRVRRWLVSHGASVNDSLGPDHTTPLEAAVRTEQVQAIRTLLELGADVNYVEPPLRDLRVKLADGSNRMHDGRVLELSIQQGSLAVLRMLIDAGGDIKSGRAFATAIARRRFGAADIVLDAAYEQIKPGSKEQEDFIQGANVHQLAASDDSYTAILERLLDFGASAETKNISGDVPLHRAAYADQPRMAEILISRMKTPGPMAQNNLKQTPLHVAAQKAHVRVLRLLLHRPNVDVGIKDWMGRTPLEQLVLSRQSRVQGRDVARTVELLLAHGAEMPEVPYARSARARTAIQLLDKWRRTNEPVFKKTTHAGDCPCLAPPGLLFNMHLDDFFVEQGGDSSEGGFSSFEGGLYNISDSSGWLGGGDSGGDGGGAGDGAGGDGGGGGGGGGD